LILISISLAIAVIPEGLPATVSIVMAIGIKKMAKQHALVKTLHSVETLGSVSVVCSDKTGTLTLNQMTIINTLIGLKPIDVNLLTPSNSEFIMAGVYCNTS
jgi:Ca2+-transporting ATPase